MTNVKKNMTISRKPFPNKGLSIREIEELEKKYNQGKEFVKAFREYLFLAGENNNFAFDDLGEGLDELQNIVQEDMDFTGQKIDKRYFAFDVLDRMYSVILLDEDAEDPLVYLLNPYGFLDGDTPLLKSNGWYFTALVNERIRRVKNNLPM